MPHFFFNVYDDAVALDGEGLELCDVDAARAEAVRGARALACEQVAGGQLNLRHWIEVTDNQGKVIATVTFGDAIALVDD